jgi:hypothetical protein
MFASITYFTIRRFQPHDAHGLTHAFPQVHHPAFHENFRAFRGRPEIGAVH